MTPNISIVVPVKNGIATLPAFIEGVKKQTHFNNVEVVIIDSASTDGSVAYLSQFSFVKVISIDPKTFNHGATRNLGVTYTQGEFIVMTVQDATPTDAFWLEKMLAHFKDKEVMGVCGQQVVPHDKDKNPHEWFRPQSKGGAKKVKFKSKQEFLDLSPKEQRQCCGWDDVNAMYRKQALLNLPFEPLVFGEDMLWAKMALEKGYTLVYDTTARVYHYHFQFPTYTYKRVLISKLFIYKCFNYFDDRTYSYKDYALVVYRNFKWKCAPKWITHNFNLIANHRKATHTLATAIKMNKIEALEKELAVNIPQGTTNKT
ncbi:glycosyltransferase family 2 protein [Winogradskyella schleiferi]|uniref:glycosyltransferase family 2 protein n=1 Tax=Winogradskyella schleiferi TaxID=2686078 RepID=UPI0015BFA30F|nr:glycosyltransferase family 2 protein [Winogradskyella schleiferi]